MRRSPNHCAGAPTARLSHAAGTLGISPGKKQGDDRGQRLPLLPFCRSYPSADRFERECRIKTDETERMTVRRGNAARSREERSCKPGDIVTELFIPAMRVPCGMRLLQIESPKIAGSGCRGRCRHDTHKSADVEMRGSPHRSWRRRAHGRAREKSGIDPDRGNLSQTVIEEAAQAAAEESKPIDDVRASAWYRKKMVAVATKRAIHMALEQSRQIYE